MTRTFKIELTGLPNPNIVMDFGQPTGDEKLDKLAQVLKVTIGSAITEVMKPMILGTGFGQTREEATKKGMADMALNEATKNAAKTPAQ